MKFIHFKTTLAFYKKNATRPTKISIWTGSRGTSNNCVEEQKKKSSEKD